MTDNDQFWLSQLEQGEEKAFQKLFGLLYAPLAALAYHFINDRNMAEDIVQDVLYELWRKKLHFDSIPALKSYLYKMVHTRSLNIISHRKVEEKFAREQYREEDSESFFYRILEDEVFVSLRHLVSTLPEQTARVFELVFDGYSNTEIAGSLGMTMDAVKGHKKRGRKILQEKMKQYVLLYLFFND